jgi:hypothetical protein
MSSASREHDGRIAARGRSLTVLDDSASRRLRASPADETLLYRLIEEHWPTFLEASRTVWRFA